MRRTKGSDLPPALQRQCLAAYVHRCTGEHIPQWARRGNGSNPYRVQFKDDAEWLANTYFFVTDRGQLSRRHHYCESTPTWNGPLITRSDHV
jgi:hypothetical protein